MSISGILTQAQATDINLATSVRQWLINNVVTPYNTEALAAGLNQGMGMQPDGTWKADTNGLGIIEGLPDDKSIYERVPVIAYSLDYKLPKAPYPTGMGDGAAYEYRSVSIVCLPAISSGSDGVIQASRQSQWILKTHLANAVSRANVLPIVDHSQGIVAGNYPQIGYAELHNQRIHGMERVAQMLDANRLRFDVQFDLCWAVTTTN
jgi:hypothetical protein